MTVIDQRRSPWLRSMAFQVACIAAAASTRRTAKPVTAGPCAGLSPRTPSACDAPDSSAGMTRVRFKGSSRFGTSQPRPAPPGDGAIMRRRDTAANWNYLSCLREGDLGVRRVRLAQPTLAVDPFIGPAGNLGGAGAGLAPAHAQGAERVEPVLPFVAEHAFEEALDAPRQRRAAAIGRDGDDEIAAAQDGRRMQRAELGPVLDMEERAQRPRRRRE